MTQAEETLAYEILDLLLESLESKPDRLSLGSIVLDTSPRPPGMSLSSAGKGTRYLAHMQVGTVGTPATPRYKATMAMGTLAHDYVRAVLASHPDVELTDAEREVYFPVSPKGADPELVEGHIDGFMKYKNKRILLDIKCVNLYTFNDLDPRNPETNWWARAKKWNAGNYVFDAMEMFSGDFFKKDYLAQVGCYESALSDEGEEWDATVFILYCRDTSHFAVGVFSPSKEEFAELVEGARGRMCAVLDNPTPLDYEPCWDAAVGSEPHKVCQYCLYKDNCFDINTTVFRGKPRHTIKRIH